MNFQVQPMRLAQIMDIQQEEEWLIEGLWSHQAVGLIGGEPKTCKSWFALDMALSVSTATNCLGKFKATEQKPVLYIAGEDRLVSLKARLSKIAAARNVDISDIPLYLVEGAGLNLSSNEAIDMVIETAIKIDAGLIIIDPLIRFHKASENSSASMNTFLDGIRKIQRSTSASIVLVHHFKKGPESKRGGQALRGSSELHAWGDSNIYLRWDNATKISVEVEQRSAQAPDSFYVKLCSENASTALAIHNEEPPKVETLRSKILNHLENIGRPLSASQIAQDLHIRKSTVLAEVDALYADQKLCRDADGFRINPLHDDIEGSSHCPWGVS